MTFTKLSSKTSTVFFQVLLFMFIMGPAWSFGADYTLAVTANASGPEEGGPLTFTVGIAPVVEVGQSVDIDWRINNGTADQTTDLSGSTSGSMSFTNATGLTQDVTVSINDELTVEGNETFVFEIHNATVTPAVGNTVSITTSNRTGTISNTDVATFTIIANGAAVENAGPIAFTVQTTETIEDSAADIVISYDSSVAGGDTAAAGDFSGSGNITFSGTSQSEGFTINLSDDDFVEGDETFTASITGVSSGPGVIGGVSSRQGTIENDDEAVFNIVADGSALENAGPISFTVQTTETIEDSAADIVISYDSSVAGGDTAAAGDFSGSGNITFSGTSQSEGFTINLSDDDFVEGDETFTASITGVSSGPGVIGGVSSRQGTIENDDEAVFNIVADGSALENAGPISFTVQTTETIEDSAADIVISYDSSVAGGDTAAAGDFSGSGNITFSGTSQSEGFTINLSDDDFVEGDETFTASITGVSSGPGVIGGVSSRQGTIENDDEAVFNIVADGSALENAGPISFTVLTTETIEDSAADIVISYDSSAIGSDTAEAGDFSGSGNVTFIGTSQSESFDIAIVDDSLVEGDETFTVELISVSAGSASIGGGSSRQGTITNDDVPTLTVNDSLLDEGDTGNTATGLQVTNNLAIADNATVSFDWEIIHGTTTGADFNEATFGSFSLTDVAAGSAVLLPLTLATDTVVEEDEDYTVTISNALITNTAVAPGDTASNGLIRNDDSPELSIQAFSSDAEGDSGQLTVNYVVTSSLVVADNASVNFECVISDSSSGLGNDLNNGLYSFAITDGVSVDVPVLVSGDTVVEGDETYTVTLTSAGVPNSSVGALINAPQSIGTGTIENNDIPTLSINDSSVFEGDAGSTATAFEVSTDLEIAADTSVSFDWLVNHGSTDNADFAPNPPVSAVSLTFSGVAAGSVVSVPLSIASDLVDEADETYSLELTNAAISNTTGSPVLEVGDGEILNNDHTFTISKTVEPTRGTLTGGGHAAPDSGADEVFVVARGTDLTFTMAATDTCYHIEDFQVDGTSEGKLAGYNNQSPDYNDYTSDSYTFTSVDGPHAVNLDFAINTYTIATESYGANGTITDTTEYNCDDSGVTVTATADPGYYITWFTVDGVPQAGAVNQTTFDYVFPSGITEDHLVEVAFAVKLTLLHDPNEGFGLVTVYQYDSGTDTSTELTLDDEFSVVVDYEAVLRIHTMGETHTVQGPDYIADPQQLDDRIHEHHLSKITDNNTVSNAFCGAGFSDPDYRSDAECQYTIPSMIENHSVEILFTGFIDVSVYGFGDIRSLPDAAVSGTDGGSAIGQYEFEAGEERVLTFDPAEGWLIQSLDYKIESEDIASDPGMVGISRAITFTVPPDIDTDHALHVDFAIDTFSITASSTFEELLFHDAALTDHIRIEDGDTVTQVNYNEDKEYYILLNDIDFSMVGVAIDNTFIPIKTIRGYAADNNASNPDSDVFTFSITPATPPDPESGTKEVLTVTFKNVKVSHYLEVRDYDNVVIADVPLDAQANPNPPALMFVTDDSGSMDWEFMVQGASSGLYGGLYYLWEDDVVPSSVRSYNTYYSVQGRGRQDEWKSQWFGHNKMYYNPTATYDPWPDYKGVVEYDEDGDGTVDEIGSRLPATDTVGDNKAHANIYRPRHHAWHNVSCDEALTMAANRRNGTIPTPAELEDMRSACDASSGDDNWEQTFDMDKEFQFIGLSDGVELQGEGPTAKTGSWINYSNNSCYENTYQYNSGGGTATYSYTPTETTDHTLEVSWRRYDSRSTSVPYRIQCPTCTPAIDVTVSRNQQVAGYYDDGMVTLGTFAFEMDEPVTITVGPTGGGTMSIDAMRLTWVPTLTTKISSIIDAHYYTFDDLNNDGVLDESTEDVWLVNLTDPITYTKVKNSTQDISSANLENLMYGGDPGLPSTLLTYVAPDDPDAFVLERQNFADWFSYYRTRQLAATSAEALAIDRMSNVEVGFHTINNSSTYGISQSALPVKVWGKRDKTKYLHYLLYSFEQGSKGTPLRSGLRDVAKYFDATDGLSGGVRDTVQQSGLTQAAYTCGTGDSDSDDYLSPFAMDPSENCEEKNGDRCKVTIAILVTDGYWNGYYSDGLGTVSLETGHSADLGPLHNNSLAKTAYHYRYKRDLMNDDEGEEQYMITYGVAFGLNGYRTFDEDLKCSVADASECPDWPTPSSGSPSTIDDLWHASVTGGGRYLNADSPVALVRALQEIINDLEGKEGSSASLAVNGDELYESIEDGIRMYQASWATDGWTGDLKAYDPEACTITDGMVDLATCELWSAQTTLGSPPTASRIIASYNPWSAGGSGIPFQYSSLDPTQQDRLFPYYAHDIADPEENVVNFIRGDVTLDPLVAQKLRSRPYALGDIVNSQGRFQRYEIDDSDGDSPGDANYDPTYTGVIFVGANDGMLHAFSADDADKGKELFAYVPGLVYRNLRELADPDYKDTKHKMFVDATPYTKTINDGSTEKTILVGGLGKGGKGFYALDITNAHEAITSEAELASRVLWEYPPAPDKITTGRKVSFTANRIEFDTPLTMAEQSMLKKYTHFEIVGANNASGSLVSSNDGIFEIADADNDGVLDGVAADGTYIEVSTSAFDVMANINITILGSIADRDMGYSFSRATIVQSNDSSVGYGGWIVIFGNGFGSENGDSVLYILNPVTGALIEKIYTTRDGVHGNGFSGMATPKMIDVKNNLKTDYVYGGDLMGNMWKFDLTSTNHSDWQVAFCDGSTSKDVSDCIRTDGGNVLASPGAMIPQPLFSTGGKQPITSAPDIMRHQSSQGYMVIFGSGKYLGWLDIINTDTQSLYGIWDWAPDTHDEGYLGSRSDNGDYVELTHYPQQDALGVPLRSLLKQGLVAEGTISEDINGDGTLEVDEDINENGVEDYFWYYRIPTAYEGDWRVVNNSLLQSGDYAAYSKENGPDNMAVPVAHMGWVVDLPGKLKKGVGSPPTTTPQTPYAEGPLVDASGNQLKEYYDLGERFVNDTIIRDGKAIMITFGLNGDKCGASAYSFLNERNAHTGGMLTKPNYDTDGDGDVDWDDVVDDPDEEGNEKWIATDGMFEGRMFNPIILRDEETGDPKNPTEDKYLSGSVLGQGLNGAKIEKVKESAERLGVHYWQQVE